MHSVGFGNSLDTKCVKSTVSEPIQYCYGSTLREILNLDVGQAYLAGVFSLKMMLI